MLGPVTRLVVSGPQLLDPDRRKCRGDCGRCLEHPATNKAARLRSRNGSTVPLRCPPDHGSHCGMDGCPGRAVDGVVLPAEAKEGSGVETAALVRPDGVEHGRACPRVPPQRCELSVGGVFLIEKEGQLRPVDSISADRQGESSISLQDALPPPSVFPRTGASTPADNLLGPFKRLVRTIAERTDLRPSGPLGLPGCLSRGDRCWQSARHPSLH